MELKMSDILVKVEDICASSLEDPQKAFVAMVSSVEFLSQHKEGDKYFMETSGLTGRYILVKILL